MNKLKARRKSSYDPPISLSDSDTASSSSSGSRRQRSPHPHGHGNSPKRFQTFNLAMRGQTTLDPFAMMDSPDGSDWTFSFIYLHEGSPMLAYESDHLYGLLWLLNGSAILTLDGTHVPMHKNDCIIIPEASSWKLAPRKAPPLVAIRAIVVTPPAYDAI